ncbi:MAG: 2Fe-2S iron-sulfur cluster-binding protein [Spirochaetota bacterium]|nr:2Fe-2S iron-sulfur cluster-binding protein [Spirochaetota bacterium]
MKVSFTLNGQEVSVDAPPSMRLVDLLHNRLKIDSMHPSCYQGECGNCAVLYNGELSYSCMMPVFSAEGSSIWTFEGISQTDEYGDIIRGLREEQAFPCSYCLPSKVVIIHSILENTLDPSTQEVLEVFSGTYCPCTNFHNLARGVIRAGFYRRRRLHA